MKKIEEYILENREEWLRGLSGLLEIPTISAQPEHGEDMKKGVLKLETELKKLGFSTEVWETPGHPAIFAETKKNPSKPTVLVYGHYDVQPPDPLDEWDTPPFEPVVRDGYIFARGASDNKGQFYIYLKAMEAILKTSGELPVNCKMIIEGEEEVGSLHLGTLLEEKKDRLKCDHIMVSDTAFLGKGIPSICYGLRGISFIECKLRGASVDCHSGVMGGVIDNPARVLACLLAGLHNEEGSVNIPGFYEDVLEISTGEKTEIRVMPIDEEEFLSSIGVEQGAGERGYHFLERRWVRPTLEINGMHSGYTGIGSKTIIPATASVKLSARLVPDQDPVKILKLIQDTLEKRCPPTMKIEFTSPEGAAPFLMDRNSEIIQKACESLEYAFGKKPIRIREGGSIPIVVDFQNILGVSPLLIGFGLPDDRIHAPNERFSLEQFWKGVTTICHFMASMGQNQK